MTKKEADKLRRAIRKLIRAEVACSWMGSQPPEDHAAITAELLKAAVAVEVIITRLTEPT